MNNIYNIRVEAKNKIYEVLFTNREYSLLPYNRLMEILDNIESVILLMTEEDFCRNQIRENKAKLYNKFYMNNFTFVLNVLENNNNLITDLSTNVCDESIIYKKHLEELVGSKTRDIIIKQNNKKSIKVKITYSDTLCKYCGNKTVKESLHTRSIDECDVVVRHCDTCDRRY